MYQYSPMQPYPMPTMAPNISRQEITKVNGDAGANAYQLPPNSSILLLDETAPKVYLAQSDGAGYKTITAYKIEPYIEPKQVELSDIIERLKVLEGRVDEQSGFRHDPQTKRNKQDIKRSTGSLQRNDAE